MLSTKTAPKAALKRQNLPNRSLPQYVRSIHACAIHIFILNAEQLKKTFDIIQDIQSKSGWTWTNKNGANIGYGLTAASGTWDAYVKAIPAAARFKNAGWVNLALMEELMGVRIAKGSHVFRASQAFVIPDGDEASSDERAGSLPWDMENPNYNDGADGVDDGDRTGANDDDGAGGNDDEPEGERRSSVSDYLYFLNPH